MVILVGIASSDTPKSTFPGPTSSSEPLCETEGMVLTFKSLGGAAEGGLDEIVLAGLERSKVDSLFRLAPPETTGVAGRGVEEALRVLLFRD